MKFTVNGYKNLVNENINLCFCPKCDAELGTGIILVEGKGKCYQCGYSNEPDLFKWKKIEKPHLICNNCKSHNPLIDDYKTSFPYYQCSNCYNVLAIEYHRKIFQPQMILDFSWNPDLKTREKSVNDQVYYTCIITDKDRLVIKMMQLYAQNEDGEPFKFGSREYNDFLLYFTMNDYIGFIMWNKIDTAINQIFVQKKYRNNGYGTLMFKHWFEKIVKKKKFVAESPNQLSGHIMEKLGYIRTEGDSWIGLKCTFMRQ
jgi:hypothetical protein